MKPLFFISDIHLGGGAPEEQRLREARFIAFLDHVRSQGRGLVIVGDLFDFWFEYRSVMPRRYLTAILALKQLVDHGLSVTLVGGNHDFWAGDFFERDLDIPVYLDDFVLATEGRRYFITHGDGLARDDKGYRILKKVLRHPLSNWLFRLLHPDLGFALADTCSALSRRHRPFETADDDYEDFARRKLAEGFDGVVLGHTHRPRFWKNADGAYLNLGDWIDNFTYGRLHRGQLTLERWPIDTKAANDPTP